MNRFELSLNETIVATGGVLRSRPHHEEIIFRGISTDSRQCRPGNLFVALTGDTFDGHDYLAQAIQKGVAGLLVHRQIDVRTNSIPVIMVPNTLQALGDLSHYWRNRFSPTIIAITGSSGKTTTKEMIAAILGSNKTILKTDGNFNNLIGLPLTIFNMHHGHDLAILEMGTNRPGEIARLTEIAVPEVGLITNIGPAHLEGFTDVKGVAAEKIDLFCHMPINGTIIVNQDDPFLRKAGKEWKGKRISFGLKAEAEVRADNISCDIDLKATPPKGASFTLHVGDECQEICIPLTGMHNIMNALAAAASAWAAGATIEVICRGLSNFTPVPGRMEVISLSNGTFIINDTYNANPSSVREALKTLKIIKKNGRSIAVLGDMLELGNQEEVWHQEIGGLLADTGVSRAYLRGRLSGATAAGASNHGFPLSSLFLMEDEGEIAKDIISFIRAGDWILIKGSRRMKMEAIVENIRTRIEGGNK